MNATGAKQGLILTMDQEEVLEGVPVMPVRKWRRDLASSGSDEETVD